MRDAIASVFEENLHVIFNGNGYSAEWPEEAKKRGLPNLRETPAALATFASSKNKELFETHGVLSAGEVAARQEIMLEEYSTTLQMEAETALSMVHTGVLPALAKDLKAYQGSDLAGNRPAAYSAVASEATKLADLMNDESSEPPQARADFFAGKVKPQLEALRLAVDTAEELCDAGLWPVPSYHKMLFSHHSLDAFSSDA